MNNLITSTAVKLQQTTDELGYESYVSSVPFIYIEGLKLKVKEVKIIQTNIGSSNSHIYGHPVNGVYGIATGLGGGQIVYGDTTGNVSIDILKRSYAWETTADFERGTKSENIDISQGFIQLGDVTVDNILLIHSNITGG